MFMHVYLQTCVHVCINTYIHIYMHAYICGHIHTYVYPICVFMDIHTQIYASACLLHTCMHVCLCRNLYMPTYIHI